MRSLPLVVLALLTVGCGKEERPLSGPVTVSPRGDRAADRGPERRMESARPPLDSRRPARDKRPAPSDAGELELERVVDGDTFYGQRNGRQVKVRLLRVNTAERGDFGYKQGTDELKRQLGDGPVRIETEGKSTKDRFGRTLAYVYVGNRLVNVEMVRSGWSKYYTKYGKGGLEEQFEAAEDEARRERRGLWSRER